MKLGVSINLFNGEELLKSCLESIRPYADVIVIIYQNVSNFGTERKNLNPLLDQLKAENLFDACIKHEPDYDFSDQDEDMRNLITDTRTNFNGVDYDHTIFYGVSNEIQKRNKGLTYLRIKGCTHLLDMDTDEFYAPVQIKQAISLIDKGGYDSSFCQMTTYYKHSDTFIYPKEKYYVPFIYKIKESSRFEQIDNADFPVVTDGKRRIKSAYPYVFSREEMEMHHMSYVRKDENSLRSKFLNCSSKMNFPDETVSKYVEGWLSFRRGDQAFFNHNGTGIQLCETRSLAKPIIKIKL